MHGSCCMVNPSGPQAELGNLRVQSQLRTPRSLRAGQADPRVRMRAAGGSLTAVLLASMTMPGAIHHSVVVVRDLAASLRFYRDGLGLELLQDRQVEGDWPGLLDAPSRSVRAVFLGDPQVPDDHAGVLELNQFDGDVAEGPPASPRRSGFLLLSFFVDVEAALGRLASLGLGGSPRRVSQPTPNGSITVATVRDPDGLLVLLTPGSITRRA
jgi:catechol 2,3-dioxygenase-like lactoylglutathione lyase family enzyme